MKSFNLPSQIEGMLGTGWNVVDNILYIGYDNNSEAYQLTEDEAKCFKSLEPDFSGELHIMEESDYENMEIDERELKMLMAQDMLDNPENYGLV